MKFIFAIVLFALVSCTNTEKKVTQHMPGAYSMLSQSINDGKKDTTYTNMRQLKIYTEDYMMYANINPADSVSGFGIGTYTASDTGTVTENVIYSANDTSANASTNSFTLYIEKTTKGYKQVIPEIGSGEQKFKLTEEYDSVGTPVKSALDGAWKQIKSYGVSGTDTINRTGIQYKTYYAGHFIWGHTYTDSTNKLHTGMGFGTFAMNGENKVKETVSESTYYEVRGQSVDIDVEMNGADEYKQTITNSKGDKNVEVYQRLKK